MQLTNSYDDKKKNLWITPNNYLKRKSGQKGAREKYVRKLSINRPIRVEFKKSTVQKTFIMKKACFFKTKKKNFIS